MVESKTCFGGCFLCGEKHVSGVKESWIFVVVIFGGKCKGGIPGGPKTIKIMGFHERPLF